MIKSIQTSKRGIKIFDIPHQANPTGMFVRLKYIYGWRRHTNSPSDAVGYFLNPAKDKKIKDKKFQRYIVTHCSMPPTVFGEGCGLLWIGGFSLRHCPVACYNINMEKHNNLKIPKVLKSTEFQSICWYETSSWETALNALKGDIKYVCWDV